MAKRWRHKKRGSTYTEVGHALFQNSGEVPVLDDSFIVVYRSDDGHLYARPLAEFMDGRFEHLGEDVPPDPGDTSRLDPRTINVLATAFARFAPDLADALRTRWAQVQGRQDQALAELLTVLRGIL